MYRVEAPIYILSEIQALESQQVEPPLGDPPRSLDCLFRHLRHAAAEEIDDSQRVLGIAVELSARAEIGAPSWNRIDPQPVQQDVAALAGFLANAGIDLMRPHLRKPAETAWKAHGTPSLAGSGTAISSTRSKHRATCSQEKLAATISHAAAACRRLSGGSESSSRQAAAKSAGESAIRMSSIG